MKLLLDTHILPALIGPGAASLPAAVASKVMRDYIIGALLAASFLPSVAIADEGTVMLQCMQKAIDETKALCQGDALCLKESKTYFHLTPGDIASGVCGPLSYDIVRHPNANEDRAKDDDKLKSDLDTINRVFDRQHPDCKAWKTNNNLPEYCY